MGIEAAEPEDPAAHCPGKFVVDGESDGRGRDFVASIVPDGDVDRARREWPVPADQNLDAAVCIAARALKTSACGWTHRLDSAGTMTDFTPRPMAPTDGPAMDRLLREEAQTTTVALTTSYQHDVYQALLAQHPSLFGVVAEAPDGDGLAGMATAFLQQVSIGGQAYPAAYLENLKVRADHRRHGLGGRLAAWRIEEAERRAGPDLVVMATMDSTNAASIATARRWATQVVGPLTLRIAKTGGTRPSHPGTRVRPLAHDDVDAVIAGAREFLAAYDLAPVLSADGITALLAPTSLGEPIRQYRVAVDADGTIVAGAGVGERYKVMVDHIDNIPAPMALLGRLTGMLPADRILRSLELFLAWHRPGRVDAARLLWDTIRAEWRDRATGVVGIVDPRSTLLDAFRVGRLPGPRVELMVAVRGPVPIADDRLIYLWR
jgi:predicted N-acetyltransferase YhbS